jgi:hypothetical protein
VASAGRQDSPAPRKLRCGGGGGGGGVMTTCNLRCRAGPCPEPATSDPLVFVEVHGTYRGAGTQTLQRLETCGEGHVLGSSKPVPVPFWDPAPIPIQWQALWRRAWALVRPDLG